MSKRSIWMLWLCGVIALGAYCGYRLFAGGADKSVFLIGAASDGHHQIELACGACHTSPFGGGELLQKACVNCHGEALKAGHDAHPMSKFTDPRNADRLAFLDARYCVTCHREHRREQTRAMGLTLPDDYCFYCHRDIARDRPSHAGMAFNTCASAGCHNYHDNRALYTDFLVKFAHEPALQPHPAVPGRATAAQKHPGMTLGPALTAAQADASATERDPHAVDEWAASAHAAAGINCRGCHQPRPGDAWSKRPAPAVCQGCHRGEAETFFQGKHGMRLDPRLPQPLTPMTPAMGRLPFKAAAAHKELTCNTCHGAHRYDTRRAAVESCLSCHDDEHSRAYERSPHARLWRAELDGSRAPGSGVSCATCHMPRETRELEGGARVLVVHNQNANLRPNEKMIRSVCQHCHGLPFAIDALGDPALIRTNFTGHPQFHSRSIEMAERHEAEHQR